MGKPIFYILDVFAEEKYAGNQLAVFRHVAGMGDDEMQTIAKEMNFSETTFILSDERRDGGYDVRIFMPTEELPFAGHPTLGTAFVIQREIIGQSVDSVVLNLPVGQIPVSFVHEGEETGLLWMRQNEPTFLAVHHPSEIVPVLGLTTEDVDTRFPIQQVSTGVPCLIVPLISMAAVKKARTVRDRYKGLVDRTDSKGILVFSSETYGNENDLNARFFDEAQGVPEDPATGSANGCLTGYLVKHRYFGKPKLDITVEQGYEIGRPSRLYLRGEERKGHIDVRVGGRVCMVARGQWG